MEKKDEQLNEIKSTIEWLILENFNDINNEIGFSNNNSLSNQLDSMAICLLIVRLEDIYHIEFPIELFNKDDSIDRLAEKIYNIYKKNL